MRIPLPKSQSWNEWHRWFAWHPIAVDGTVVWLETVERYISGFEGIGHYFEYRTFTPEAP